MSTSVALKLGIGTHIEFQKRSDCMPWKCLLFLKPC